MGYALITGLLLISGCGGAPDDKLNLYVKGERTTTVVVGEIRHEIFPAKQLCHSQFSVRVFSYRIVGNYIERIAESGFTANSDERLLIFPKQRLLISPSVDGVAYFVTDENEAGCGVIEFMGWFEEGLKKAQDLIKHFDGGYSIWINPDYYFGRNLSVESGVESAVIWGDEEKAEMLRSSLPKE